MNRNRPRHRLRGTIVSVGLTVSGLIAVSTPTSAKAVPKASPSPVFAQWAGSSTHNPVMPGDGYASFVDALENQPIIGGISSVGNTLYVGSNSGEVFAVNRMTGRVLWHAMLPNEVMSTPLVIGNLAVFGVGNSEFAANQEHGLHRIRGTGPSGLYALNRHTGAPVWHVTTRGECMPTAVYHDGDIYQMTGSGDLLQIDAQTGTVRRHLMLGEFDSMASPSLQGNTLVVATAPQVITALSLPSLHVLWRTTIPSIAGTTDDSPALDRSYVVVDAVTRLHHLSGSLAYGTETLFVLDSRTGKIFWHVVLGSGHLRTDVMQTAVPTIHDGVVYVGSPIAKHITGFQLATARKLWSFATHGEIKDDPVIVGGQLYASDSAGYVYDLSAPTGRLIASHKLTAGTRVYGSGAAAFGIGTGGLLLVGGTFYCASSQGQLFAFPRSAFTNGHWPDGKSGTSRAVSTHS